MQVTGSWDRELTAYLLVDDDLGVVEEAEEHGSSFTVFNSERVATDAELLRDGITSQRYLSHLKALSKSLAKKARLNEVRISQYSLSS